MLRGINGLLNRGEVLRDAQDRWGFQARHLTIGAVLGLPEDQRAWGTAATVALAIAGGADVVRVHDVAAMAQVARMADAIVRPASV